MKVCKKCKVNLPLTEFFTNGKTPRGTVKYKPACKACSYAEQRKFVEEKTRLIDEKYGSCCKICGYDKCKSALEFHHLDQSKKEFTIGNLVSNFARVDTLEKELEKCILLCSNCHREVHAGITKLPSSE